MIRSSRNVENFPIFNGIIFYKSRIRSLGEGFYLFYELI